MRARTAGLSLFAAGAAWLLVVPPAWAAAIEAPRSGEVGKTIEVSGAGCTVARAFVILVVNPNQPNEKDQATATAPVTGGAWKASLTVPPDTPLGKAQLDAGCGTPESVQMDYDLVDFEVLAAGAQPSAATTTTTTAARGATTTRVPTTLAPLATTATTRAAATTTTTRAATAATATSATTATTRAATGTTTAGGGFPRTGVDTLSWTAVGLSLLAGGQWINVAQNRRLRRLQRPE